MAWKLPIHPTMPEAEAAVELFEFIATAKVARRAVDERLRSAGLDPRHLDGFVKRVRDSVTEKQMRDIARQGDKL